MPCHNRVYNDVNNNEYFYFNAFKIEVLILKLFPSLKEISGKA
jgi:hypothetical protein